MRVTVVLRDLATQLYGFGFIVLSWVRPDNNQAQGDLLLLQYSVYAAVHYTAEHLFCCSDADLVCLLVRM